MPWDLSCPDWAERLRTGRSPISDHLPLDLVAGNRAVAVFNKLRLYDVSGTPTLADACGDWFRNIVRTLFGSLDPVTRERAIRELFVLVGKKNAKTTYGALLMLTALLLNERPSASLIMTAPVQDVAQLAFDAAAGAIRLDPVLDQKLHIVEHRKKIIHRETKAELEIMSFDPAALTGQKPVAALIDELHVVSKMSKAASAIRQLRGGMLPFPEAFMAFITTQSEEAPSGVFKAELTKARAIRDGKREGVMLPVTYEFTEAIQREKDAWRNVDLWPMVVPNMDRSIKISRLQQEMKTAEETSKEELIAWASQHLNVQVGTALHTDQWAGSDFWEAQGDDELTLDALLERCEVVTIGLDGGGLDDLLGMAVVGRERETRKWLAWAHAWAHRIVLERRPEIAPKLLDFQEQGDLTIVDKPGDDVDAVADIVVRINKLNLLPEENAIGVDAVGIGDIIDELTSPARGIDAKRIIGISQGWKLNGAIKTTERKVAGGELEHGNTPMMAWCVSNARTSMAGNALVITKQVSGTAKIDPLMALFDAVTLIAINPKAYKKPEPRMLVLG